MRRCGNWGLKTSPGQSDPRMDFSPPQAMAMRHTHTHTADSQTCFNSCLASTGWPCHSRHRRRPRLRKVLASQGSFCQPSCPSPEPHLAAACGSCQCSVKAFSFGSESVPSCRRCLLPLNPPPPPPPLHHRLPRLAPTDHNPAPQQLGHLYTTKQVGSSIKAFAASAACMPSG